MVLSSLSLLERVSRALPRGVSERLALTRRDVVMVLDGLAGRVPSPIVRRHKVERPQRAAVHGRLLRVAEVVRETADAVSLVLEDPTGAALDALPGQFLTVCVTVDGTAHKRAYSLSNAPGDPPRITVKRVESGIVSTYLTTRVAAGDTLEALGPSGSFTLGASGEARHLVLLGAGSGITPLYAIATAALARDDGSRVSLVYGNRAREDVIFGAAIDALALAHPGRFAVRHALESPPEGFDGITGRLDAAALTAALDALSGDDLPREYFVCGPTPMREAARATLIARGVDAARVREEVYTSPHAPARGPGEALVVRIRAKGRDAAVTVRAGETILDAAAQAGLDMPFSCTVGGCGACQCKRVAGEVVMEEPNCLSDAERAAGAVLTCVGRPAGPGVVLEVP